MIYTALAVVFRQRHNITKTSTRWIRTTESMMHLVWFIVLCYNYIYQKIARGMYMETCPNCKSKLNGDEKASGSCFSCGALFESVLPKDTKQHNYNFSDDVISDSVNENSVAKTIRICGILIIILGTISSFLIAGDDFSFALFLTSEIISIVGGLFFVGFSEIIRLLESIKNKLK